MPCGSKLVARRVRQSLGLPVRPKEVLVKVVVVTHRRLDTVRVRVRMGTRVFRLDQVAVRAEVVLRLRVLQGMEAEAVVRRRRVLQVVEAGTGVLPRLALLLEVVLVVDVVDRAVALLGAHRFRRGRRGRQTILRIFLMKLGSRKPGIRVVLLAFSRRCSNLSNE